MQVTQAETSCLNRASASMSGAGLRRKHHGQLLTSSEGWLLISCPDGTAHMGYYLRTTQGHQEDPQTSNNNDKDQLAFQYSAENSYKSTVPYLQDIPKDTSPASTSVLGSRK